jgi:hypothetical protein
MKALYDAALARVITSDEHVDFLYIDRSVINSLETSDSYGLQLDH